LFVSIDNASFQKVKERTTKVLRSKVTTNMNFQPEYNGTNNKNSGSFVPSVEKKQSYVADLSLKRSSLQVQVRAPGPVWSPRSAETPSIASADKTVSERKKRQNWTKMVR
jgi:hypothetical protein